MKKTVPIFLLNLLLMAFMSTAQTLPTTTDTAIHVASLMTVQRFAVRVAKNTIDNSLYYITSNGGVYKIKKNGALYSDTLIASATQHYINSLQGFAFRDSMMYLVGNHKVPNTAGYGLVVRGKLKPNATWAWDTLMRTVTYQSSATLYDHQFNGICIAKNGDSLYINSGSRTDHGETETTNGLYPNTRDVALTSNIFQIPINPSAIINLPNDSALLATSGYVYCRGVRNSFDISLAPNGDVLATENSGDRDDPEELNWLKKNQHYGFPWRMGGNSTPMQFPGYNANNDKLINHHSAGWGNGTTTNKFYADATYPQAPAGLMFAEPIKNYGPDADKFRDPTSGSVRDASNEGTYITSFTSHRSPLGLVFDLSGNLAAPYNYGAFVLSYTEGTVDTTGTLANNSIGPFSDTSQDLLQLALFKDTATGQYSMNCYRIATNFAKPVDAFLDGNILYALESHYPSDTVAPKLYAFTFPANINGGTSPFLGKDTSFCPGGAAITLKAKLKGEYRYLWSTGATTAQLTISPAVTTNYWLRIYNGMVTLRDTITVVVAPGPNIPGGITTTGGSTKVCPGNSRTYTVALVTGITYNWLVPAGCSIISGQGTRSIQVVFNSGFIANGTLSVTASNGCGSSAPRNLTISRNVAATPSIISGPTAGLCSTTNNIYAVSNVAGVIYTWVVPAAATLVSGQGTNSIVVNFSSTNFSGNVTVRAGNACGQSGARNLSTKATPSTPVTINGSLIVCSNSINNAYNIAPIATATNYTYTAPAGSRITGNGITSASNVLTTTATAFTVNFGTVTATSTLKARANNNCGAGGTRTITLNPCPARFSSELATIVALYPNPSNGIFTLELNGLEKINYTLQVYDLCGKALYRDNSFTNAGKTTHDLNLGNLNNGMYLLTISTALGIQTIKIIKEL